MDAALVLDDAVCLTYEAGCSADLLERGLFCREIGVFGERRPLSMVVLGEVLLEIMFLKVLWFF